MIDCHTHLTMLEHMTQDFIQDAERSWGPDSLPSASPAEHAEAMASMDKVVVLGFSAQASGFVVPNDLIAQYVNSQPDKLVGFAGIDLKDLGAVDELERCSQDLGLVGIKIGPVYQDVHPLDKRTLAVLEAAERLNLPVMWHQGTTFVRQAPLKFALPLQIDEVARLFPDLRIIIAHMGHPWISECVVVVRKHPNVYSDVSALHPRPWQLYNALQSAIEYRVTDKLLFGSDFPFFTPEETVAGLKRVTSLTEGTRLPAVSMDLIGEIVERDALEVLGIAR